MNGANENTSPAGGCLCNHVKKITEALYRVTELFSDREPLKWALRNSAVELFDYLLSAEDREISDAGDLPSHQYIGGEGLFKLVKKVSRILELASSSGSFVSSINFEVLRREYLSLGDSFENQLESRKQEPQILESVKNLPSHQCIGREGFLPAVILASEIETSNAPAPQKSNGHLLRQSADGGDDSNGQKVNSNGHIGQTDSIEAVEEKEPIINAITDIISKRELLPAIVEKNGLSLGSTEGQSFACGEPVESESTEGQPILLKERKRKILALVKANEWKSIREIIGSLPGIGEKSIQRDLLEMVDSGILKKIGDKRWRKYSLV